MTARRPPSPTAALLLTHAPKFAVALAVLALAYTYAPLFRGEVCGDDNTFHYAESVRIADATRDGDLDWWNPSANGGFATGYYYQAIPAAIPGLLGAAFGHTLLWFQLGIFLPLVLVPVFGYRALRVLDADRWPAAGGGIAIALAVSNNKWGHGADGLFSVGLYTQVIALAIFPLAFAQGVRWIARGDRLGAAVAWGALSGMCHPVAGMALGAALAPVALLAAGGAFLAQRGWSPYPGAGAGPPASPWRTGARAPFLRIAILGALLLVATTAAWLPTIVDYEAFGGFPHRLPDEAGPGFAGLGRWFKQGVILDWSRHAVLTALVPAGVVVAIADPRGGHLRALIAAALVLAFVVGVGRALKTADDLFPAVRFLGALQIVLAMFAGAALLTMAQVVVRWADPLRAGVVLQVAVGLAVGLVAIEAGRSLGYQRARVRVASDFPGVHREELDQLLPAIRAAKPGRIQNRGVDNHWGMMLPYILADRPTLVAYGGAALQSSPNFVYLWRTPDPQRAAWIYDAPIVLCTHVKGSQVGGTILAQTLTYELRELASPGLVGPVQVTGTLPEGRAQYRAAVLAWQDSDAPMRNEVLAHAGHGGAGPPPDGTARAIVRGSSRITAELDARAPTTFAIRESWHPRWEATLDGRSVPIRRIAPDMMAVDAPPGRHALVLSFERPWWALASYLLLPLAIGFGAWWSRRRLDGGARRGHDPVGGRAGDSPPGSHVGIRGSGSTSR